MTGGSLAWVARSARSTKLVTLEEAIAAYVTPGSAVFMPSDARAAVRAIVRHFWGQHPRLTIIALRMGGSHCVDLIEAGLVDHAIGSSFGVQYPSFRPSKTIQRIVAEGQVRIECWSLLGLVQRLMAAGMGVPFMPTRAMAGSDLVGFNRGCRDLTDPATGATTLVVDALHPDVAFVHALAADAAGNALVPPPAEDDLWSTRAARRGVVVLAENIVSTEMLRAHSHLVRVPAYRVLAVCHVPFAAHPDGYETGIDLGLPIQKYVRDAKFYRAYYEASLASDRFRAWLEQWAVQAGTHEQYLASLGQERLDGLLRRETSDHSDWGAAYRGIPETVASPPSSTECMIAAAARVLAEEAMARGLQHCVVGAGSTELAGSLAFYLLRERGYACELVNGVGRFGYEPVPVPGYKQLTAIMLTNTVDTYGAIIGGPHSRSAALVGAGEIDRFGNINSTRSNGVFLVGSGGVNDAVGGAALSIVMMRQEARRMVERVEFVTCPGARVTHLVTDLGVFRKGSDGTFELARFFAGPGDTSREAVIERVQAACGWRVHAAKDLEEIALPTPTERRLMQWLDPERAILDKG